MRRLGVRKAQHHLNGCSPRRRSTRRPRLTSRWRESRRSLASGKTSAKVQTKYSRSPRRSWRLRGILRWPVSRSSTDIRRSAPTAICGSSRRPAMAGVASLRSGLSIRARRAPPSSSPLSWARFRAKVGRPRGCCSQETPGASRPPRAVWWLLVLAGERSEQRPVGRGRSGHKQEPNTRRSTQLFAPGLGRVRTWRSRGSVSLVAASVHGHRVGNGPPPAPPVRVRTGVSDASHRWFTAAALRRRHRMRAT